MRNIEKQSENTRNKQSIASQRIINKIDDNYAAQHVSEKPAG